MNELKLEEHPTFGGQIEELVDFVRLQFDLWDDHFLLDLWRREDKPSLTVKVKAARRSPAALDSHLDAFALGVAGAGGLSRGGGGGGGGGGWALRCLGSLGGGQREGEGGEEGGRLTQETVDRLILLHRPLGGISIRLCGR